MSIIGKKNPNASLETLGIKNTKTQYWNLNAEELVEATIRLNQGVLSDTGALAVDTGEFTGRAPKDKFIVKEKGQETIEETAFLSTEILSVKNSPS